MSTLLLILVVFLIIGAIAQALPFILIFAILFLICSAIWKIYETSYFKGEKFAAIKNRIQSYINDCNELNKHISELKQVKIGGDKLSSGRSSYQDTSSWNMKRPELRNQAYGSNIYNFEFSHFFDLA